MKSLDKAILSPPVQFIVPSPTASASPSPRLLQNCSPTAPPPTVTHHHHHQQHHIHQQPHQIVHQQQRVTPSTSPFLSDVIFVTNTPTGGQEITARRLSTGGPNHQTAAITIGSPTAVGGGGGGTILFRPSPTQSPASSSSAGIIITNGPSPSPSHLTSSGASIISTSGGGGVISSNSNHGANNLQHHHGSATTLVSNELNTTLVGSNNIALSHHGGKRILGGTNGTVATSQATFVANAQQPSGSKRMATASPHGPIFLATASGQPVATSNGIVVGCGGSSPKTGKKGATTPLGPSPIASPMASPAKPNQSPIQQIQSIMGATNTAQPLYQIIQTNTNPTQQILQPMVMAAAGQQQQAHQQRLTFQAPTTIIAQQQQVVKNKLPQQILPKPSMGGTVIATSTCNSGSAGGNGTIITSNCQPLSNSAGQIVLSGGSGSGHSSNNNNNINKIKSGGNNNNNNNTSNNNSNVKNVAKSQALVQQQQQHPPTVVHSMANVSTAILTTPHSSATVVTSTAQTASPIILPTAQPLLMSTGHHHHQMPVIVQQNTPQGVQFILRQPTNHQLTTTPLVIHHPQRASAQLPQAQPQQLLRIVNGNGQVQLAPTFIMSPQHQGNAIIQSGASATTLPTQFQAATSAASAATGKVTPDGKLNAGTTIQLGGNLVQMSAGQFLQTQFPAQNLNFAGMNQLLGQNVAFTATGQTTGSPIIVNSGNNQSATTGPDQSRPQLQFIQQSHQQPIQIQQQPQPQHHQIITTTTAQTPQNGAPTIIEDLTMDNGDSEAPTVVVHVPETKTKAATQATNKKAGKQATTPAKKDKAKKTTTAAATKQKKSPEPSPPKSENKLDLANVMKLCGIGLDDDDDDEEEMLMESHEYHMPQHEVEQQAQQQHLHQLQPQQSQSAVDAAAVQSAGDIMITIPAGINNNENIPFSFTIPTTSIMTAPAVSKEAGADAVITIEDNNAAKSIIKDDVPSFVNSALSAQITPTLQSQINEIQNQLMGVTQMAVTAASTASSTPAVVVAPTIANKPTTYVQPKVQAKVVSATATVAASASPSVPAPKKRGGTTVAQKKAAAAAAAAAQVVSQPVVKSIPTPCGLVPSQIGNIQISQVDATKKQPANKMPMSIENQIQITPILDTATTAAPLTSNVATTMSNAPSMTVTMMKQGPANIAHSQLQAPKLNNGPTLVALDSTGATTVSNVQLSLPPAMTMATAAPAPISAPQQHPLLAQLTGALSLSLVEDGRLLLKHDVNTPQDPQSQVILQTILSGALGNVTLVNEPSIKVQPEILMKPQPPPIVEPKIMPHLIKKQQPDPTPATSAPPMYVNTMPLPKIGPNQQLFSMNTVTNQITQINPGLQTASLGPMERLLIVPAGINAQQLAQCLLQGQLHFDNVAQMQEPTPQSIGGPSNVQNHKVVNDVKLQVKPMGVAQVAPTPASANNKKAKVKRVKPMVDGAATSSKAGTGPLNVKMNKMNNVTTATTTAGMGGQSVVKMVGPQTVNQGNVIMSQVKMDNTAVVRPNIIGSQGQVKVPPNKITITTTSVLSNTMNPSIMVNASPKTPIVVSSPLVTPPQAVAAPQPRVQTIQLTPQKQQLLKEVQMNIQQLSGRLKDKMLLEKLTFPMKLDENNPINNQPLPQLNNINAMSDHEITLALQRLFVEQQKILATGKVIPTIPNHQYSPQMTAATAATVNPTNSTIIQLPTNKIQLASVASVENSNQSLGGNGTGAASAIVKNLQMMKNSPLLKPQQFNEMTIKPIISTSQQTSTPMIPNKVINSTTIIPAPMIGTLAINNSIINNNNNNANSNILPKRITVETNGQTASPTAAVSIIPMLVSMTTATATATTVTTTTATASACASPIVVGGNNNPQLITATTASGIIVSTVAPVAVKQEPDSTMPAPLSPRRKIAKTSRFERQLKVDQEGCTQPDTVTPFSGREDAVKRLIRYHCNYKEFEDEDEEKMQQFVDAAYNFQDSYRSMLARYQFLLMKESTRQVQTSELVMMGRIMQADLQEDIVGMQNEIKRLEQPEVKEEPIPPPQPLPMPQPVKVECNEEKSRAMTPTMPPLKPYPTPVMDLKPMCNGAINGVTGLMDDDTTRTSVTDTQSQLDTGRDDSEFGWNDWADEGVTTSHADAAAGHRLNGSQEKQLGGGLIKSETISHPPAQVPHTSSSDFDIESEILPNFILNKKMINANDTKPLTMGDEKKLEKGDSSYDEWLCIQRELADMGVSGSNSGGSVMHCDGNGSNERKVLQHGHRSPSISHVEKQLDDLFGGSDETSTSAMGHANDGGGVGLDKDIGSGHSYKMVAGSMRKHGTQHWSDDSNGMLMTDMMMQNSTSTASTAMVSMENNHMGLLANGNQSLTTTASASTMRSTTANSNNHDEKRMNYFGMGGSNSQDNDENWLDFQQNNNSFDGFGLNTTRENILTQQQPQKRSWHNSSGGGGGSSNNSVGGNDNGLPSGSHHHQQHHHNHGMMNGGEGGVHLNGLDDYYGDNSGGGGGKKMCYSSNGDYDFTPMLMDGDDAAQGGHQSSQQVSTASYMPQQQQQQHHQASGSSTTHVSTMGMDQSSQNFDDDINQQVQNAIDSILNLQSTDSPDFQFTLDQTMGALLVDGPPQQQQPPQSNQLNVGGMQQQQHHHQQDQQQQQQQQLRKRDDTIGCMPDLGQSTDQMLRQHHPDYTNNHHMIGQNGTCLLTQDNNSPTNSTSSQSLLSSISTSSSSSNGLSHRFVDNLGINAVAAADTVAAAAMLDDDPIKSVLTS